MRATKDSGVEWLGEIPVDWLVKPLKRNTYIKARVGWKGLTSDEFEVESFAYLVTGRDFSSKVIDFSECYQVSQERYLDDPFIQLKQGDILITKDGTIGKVAWVNELDKPACLNSGIFVVRPKADYVSEFLFWVLESAVFKEFIRLVSSGSTIQHLYQNVFENFSFGIPPVEEQRRIADFLDHETAKIDALIAKQEELITTLDERRGALILSGVTGRLSTGPRKKSRLGWLGDIPDHWTESKTRFHCQVATGSGDTQDAVVDGAFPFYVRSDTPQRSERYEFDGDAVLTAGDGAGVGKVFHVVSGKFMAHQRVYVMNSFRGVTPEFFFYFFSSTFARFALDGTAKSTVDSLRRPMLTNHPILVPPLSEQIQIVELLDRAVESIDRLISAAQKTVQLLLERRQSLISAAVTGKLEVSV